MGLWGWQLPLGASRVCGRTIPAGSRGSNPRPHQITSSIIHDRLPAVPAGRVRNARETTGGHGGYSRSAASSAEGGMGASNLRAADP